MHECPRGAENEWLQELRRKAVESDQAPGNALPKFEANLLVLGKSGDSVLNTFIGLDEVELSQGLAHPLDCMEKEWFPNGFLPLEKEPKQGDENYGDADYVKGLEAARERFKTSDMEDEEYADELERLTDEYDERCWKWWIAGANFDYIRYGTVGNTDRPDENFWLPPQVRNSFQLGTYHGGPIASGDYDTGFYDTPALEIELSMDFADSGELDLKGNENQKRKDFKMQLAADLSAAASIAIPEEDLPVVNVSAKRDSDGRMLGTSLVIVHVLQSMKRGPDESWELARDLSSQSSDRNSQLCKGVLTRLVVVEGVALRAERSRDSWTLADFTDHENSQIAELKSYHVMAIRTYTSDTFPLFNNPMRQRVKPHPLKLTMYFLDEALKKLSTVEARLRPAEYNKVKYLWRGMRNMKLDADQFFAEGGTELAPMSTTGDLGIALHYSKSPVPLIFRFEARGRSRGVEIGFLSLYPKETEFLYSALTGLILLNLSQKEEHQLHEINESQSKSDTLGTQVSRQTALQEEMEKIQKELAELDGAQGAAEGVQLYNVYDVRPMR